MLEILTIGKPEPPPVIVIPVSGYNWSTGSTSAPTATTTTATTKVSGASAGIPEYSQVGNITNSPTITPTAPYNIGSGDFTMELWLKNGSSTQGNSLYQITYTGGQIVGFSSSGQGNVEFSVNNSTSSGTYSLEGVTIAQLASAWNHIAAVRRSGVLYLYWNGVQKRLKISTDFTGFTPTKPFTTSLGGASKVYLPFNQAYVAEVSFCDVAKYDGTFTPRKPIV